MVHVELARGPHVRCVREAMGVDMCILCRLGSTRVCRLTLGSNYRLATEGEYFGVLEAEPPAEKLRPATKAKTRFLCMYYVLLRLFRAKKFLWVLSRVESLQKPG